MKFSVPSHRSVPLKLKKGTGKKIIESMVHYESELFANSNIECYNC